MSSDKNLGPVEQALMQSCRADIRALCGMDNPALLRAIEAMIDSAEADFDEERFNAAQALLDERDPVEGPEDKDVALPFDQFWDKFAATVNRPEVSNTVPSKKIPKKRPNLKFLVIAAALLGVFSIAALATSTNPTLVDLRDVVVRTLVYGPSGQLELKDSTKEYSSLAEAFEKTGADGVRVPTWIPSDLALTRVTAIPDDRELMTYTAYYESDRRSLAITIHEFINLAPQYYCEVDLDTGATPWDHDGYTYTLSTNIDYNSASWDENSYAISVAGNITTDELKNIIKQLK